MRTVQRTGQREIYIERETHFVPAIGHAHAELFLVAEHSVDHGERLSAIRSADRKEIPTSGMQMLFTLKTHFTVCVCVAQAESRGENTGKCPPE